MELIPGAAYTVRLTIKNTSTKAGAPVPATLGVGILAVVSSVINLIPRQVSLEPFAAGETRSFIYDMTVPSNISNTSGGVSAWVEDPAGNRIAFASLDITVGVTVDFGGVVTDAETKRPLAGATVQMWTGDKKTLLDSVITDSAGLYRFTNILIPVTVVFVYQKTGYRDTITDPIYLGPSGGGLNIALVPMVPTLLALYYTNPNSSPTHWDVYDLDQGKWLSSPDLVKRIGEAYVFVPQYPSSLFLVFREAVNAFLDIREYGPYVIPIAGLGEYTWNARNATLNGVKATSLMNTSGSIRGRVLSQEDTNDPNYKLLTMQVLSASGSPGSYFAGMTIKVEAQVAWSLVGIEIIGNLKVQSISPGNFQQYPGFVLVISNITYPLGLPDYLYAIDGTHTIAYNENNSLRGVTIGWYSKYGLSGIPIRFVASADGVQRSIIFKQAEGGYSYYKIGDPGDQALEMTLPASDRGYWLNIENYAAISRVRLDVYLWTGTAWKAVAAITSPYG